MAFELLFFKKKTDIINLDDIENFFVSQNFIIKPLDTHLYIFLYHNKDTKVSFTVSYNEENELLVDNLPDENYEFCYMNFTLSYLRPSFFAEEAMPIIENFINRFNLLIYDVQNEQDICLKQYQSEELILSYNKNNKLACQEFNKQYPLNIVSKTKTNYFYQYNLNKHKWYQKYAINLPELNFLKHNKTGEIFTFYVWDGQEMIFPKCDYIYIIKKVKGFLGFTKQVKGLIEYHKIYNIFKDNLEDINDFNLLVLKNIDEKITELFTALPIKDFSDFEIIEIDDLVDCAL